MPYKNKAKRMEYQREYQQDWIKKRRRKYLGGRSCEHCGSDYRLNIHHINPDEKLDSRIWSWREDRIETELEKCIVLCDKCHRQLHNPRLAKHGSLTMYKNHKCRCDECRIANANYEYARRRKRASTKSPTLAT